VDSAFEVIAIHCSTWTSPMRCLEEKEIEGATVTAVTSDCSLAWSRRAISSTLLATIPVNNYNTMFSIPLHECYFKPRIYM